MEQTKKRYIEINKYDMKEYEDYVAVIIIIFIVLFIIYFLLK